METALRVDRHLVVDVALALLIASLGVAEVLVPLATMVGGGPSGVAVALVLVGSLPLALRRRFPLPVLLVSIFPWGVTALYTDVPILFWGGLVPAAIAVYSVARHGLRGEPYLGLGAMLAGLALLGFGNETLRSAGELVFPTLVLAISWTAGLMLARKHHVAVASVRRADAIESRSREETLLAIAEERARIARELHDVVAHAVTAMVVQAGAAQQVVDEDPEYVDKALDGIRKTGSQALEEMRRVVSVLRSQPADHPLSPLPGVNELRALVAASSTTQTQVELHLQGSPSPLSASQGLAVYRIVQEALTNAHRHAHARSVTVSIAYDSDRVRIEIHDDGVGRAVGTAGHGLVGMRERVAAHGGDIDFESGNGFRVHAWLPLVGQG